MKPKALILLALGTNRDQDASEALALAGANPDVLPLNDLRLHKKRFADYQLLVLPGGFSYADALGAGRLLAIDLKTYFADEITAFVDSGRPVLGICNGFQALVKSGVLPGCGGRPGEDDQAVNPGSAPTATLTFNERGHFECRWVDLRPASKKCLWTRGLTTLISCPIAHGEGNFQVDKNSMLPRLIQEDQVTVTYVRPDGSPANGEYPFNPNGSLFDIAGICNPAGNVFGLMPHPENHIHPYQHPNWTRGVTGQSGLVLFENGVKYAAGC